MELRQRPDLHVAGSIQALRRCQAGISSVEFALLAPVLCLILLTTVDLGSALTERLGMSQVLRSGAQVAMEDPGEEEVTDLMQSAASGNFHTEAEAETDPALVSQMLELEVERFCACPDEPETAVTCSTVCTGTVPTFIYYRMSAEKDFSGVLLRGLPLSTAAQVQVR
jgi:pilus assembly protein CpaE